MLRLTVRDPAVRPGGELVGTAEWSLPSAPAAARVRLLWRTAGKGDPDSAVVRTADLPAPAAEDARGFRIRLPDGPPSFSGRLISLMWSARLECPPHGAAETEIVLSPTGRELLAGPGRRARDNPFGTGRIASVRYRPAGSSLPQLLDRLDGLGRRAALVGPHGSGKTTLMEDLAGLLGGRGFRIRHLRLREGDALSAAARIEPLLSGAGAGDFLLLDSAGLLGWWDWRTFRHRSRLAGGVLVTAHRRGRLPTLWEHATDPALLAEIVAGLAADDPPPERLIREAFARRRGNLRDALRDLYDAWADEAW